MTQTPKELISRGTMAVLAIAMGAASTKLLLILINAERWTMKNSAGDDLFLIRLLIPVIVILYLVAAALGCLVFSAWDGRRSNVGRAMTIGDKMSSAVTWMARLFLWRRFD